MSQPVPEERTDALEVDESPDGEHDSDLPDESDGHGSVAQLENAESSVDQPSGG